MIIILFALLALFGVGFVVALAVFIPATMLSSEMSKQEEDEQWPY